MYCQEDILIGFQAEALTLSSNHLFVLCLGEIVGSNCSLFVTKFNKVLIALNTLLKCKNSIFVVLCWCIFLTIYMYFLTLIHSHFYNYYHHNHHTFLTKEETVPYKGPIQLPSEEPDSIPGSRSRTWKFAALTALLVLWFTDWKKHKGNPSLQCMSKADREAVCGSTWLQRKLGNMLITDPEIGTLAEVFFLEICPRILKWVNRERGLLGCLLHYVMRFGFTGTLGWTLWNTAHCYSIQGKRWLRLSSVQLPIFSWHWPSIGPRAVAPACLDYIGQSLFPIASETTEQRDSTHLMLGPVFLDSGSLDQGRGVAWSITTFCNTFFQSGQGTAKMQELTANGR